jgi:hypothetical protein
VVAVVGIVVTLVVVALVVVGVVDGPPHRPCALGQRGRHVERNEVDQCDVTASVCDAKQRRWVCSTLRVSSACHVQASGRAIGRVQINTM